MSYRNINRSVQNDEKFVIYEWKRYHLLLFLLVILLTLEAFFTGSLQSFLQSLGSYGYLGALLAGFFYTYGMTSPFSVATFFVLAERLNPFLLAFFGALSSVISEFIIYSFSRHEYRRLARHHTVFRIKISRRRKGLLKTLSPLIAGFIIASPLPDELAGAFLGSENYGVKRFMLLAFVFNFIGILFIVGLGRIF